MYRFALALLSLTVASHGYVDTDFDGVEDAYDRCPQTSLSDLVDSNGCVIHSMRTNISYDLVAGIEYSQINYVSQEPSDTITTSLQADAYTGKWWFHGIISHYQSDNGTTSASGLEDTSITAMYRFTPTEKLTLFTGAGVILPTYKSAYNNEAADYMASIQMNYILNDTFSLFAGGTHTWINDQNVPEESYQNTSGFYTGIEGTLPSGESTLSAAYHHYDSIYTSVPVIRYVNFEYGYIINPHWNIGINYAFGLSDSTSDHAFSGYLGYHF